MSATAADPALREEPLAARSGPRGATLFTELSAEQTGIVTENNYADPRMWAEHYQELAYGEMGTGLAAGDFDGDGRVDLFAVSKTGTSRLFRNLGGWKFEDVTERARLAPAQPGMWERSLSWIKGVFGAEETAIESVETWRQGATFADVNNDGRLDLYVCRFKAPNLLFINQGDGTFREEAAARGLAVVDASGVSAFSDYDADGWLDVYVTTNMLDAAKSPNGQRGYLFHNNGDGTFADVTARAGITGENCTHSAIWWDFNEDRRPDLYVANDYAAADQLYRNNGDGTFTDVIHSVVPHQSYYSMGSDTADVDNDGRIDLLVADMAATSHEKDQRGMAYSRERAQVDPSNPIESAQVMHNSLFLSTGTGHAIEAARLAGIATTDWTWSVRFEDLDGDGRVDLHVTNGMNREYHNVDLLARIMAVEDPAGGRRAVRDSPALEERNRAYRNMGDLRFEETSAAWGLDQNGVSFGAVFADFDGDGDLDMAYANYEKGVTVLRNENDSGHRIVVALRGTSSNRFGVGAKVRITTAAGVQARGLAVARGYLSSSEPVAHFGLGEESRIEDLTVEWPNGHVQRFNDVAADQRLTITESATTADRVNAELQTRTQPAHGTSEFGVPPSGGRPAGVLFTEASAPTGLTLVQSEETTPEPASQPLLPFRFDRRGPALAAADLDGDGREEILLGGTTTSPLQIHPLTSIPAEGVDDGPLLLIDHDSDGDLDLLRAKSGSSRTANYQPRLYRNETGRFEPVDALPALSIPAGAAAAADFDRDGDLDVFIGARIEPGRYPQSPGSVLLRNDTGRFTDATPETVREAGMVTSALWTDFDNDGWIDLLLATEWGPIRCFHNDSGTLTERAGLGFNVTGLWTSIASADFNGDGRPDYVAGNAGLNTPYRAPAVLLSGDFRGGGVSQIVEAHYEGDKLYPRRTRQELGAQIPSILRKFPKNDAFARATLTEILGDKLDTAKRYEAAELRSGVFLSQPDGTWRFSELPRIAQIAPLQGLSVADFNGDGHTDVYALQNSFAPIPSLGRFDGGLSQLLLGDGMGNFTPVPPAESGLLVPGDAKALLTLDLNNDGWPDLLASRNSDTTLAFTHRGVDASRSFRVVIEGPPGNPTAIGAALTLTLADGATQRVELHAGTGYYTHNPRGCFFAYPVSNPPRILTVRWPDGRTTSHELREAPPALLEIK